MVGADLTAAARDEPLAWPSAAFFILGASIMLWAGAGTAIVWLIG